MKSLLLSLLLLPFAATLPAQMLKPSTETPVVAENFDPDTFGEWVEGAEKNLARTTEDGRPQWLVWTNKTQPGFSGRYFGDTKTAGPRHLRIAFKAPIPVGTVFTTGGGALSVLRPEAAYPGDLARETDWLPAERIVKGELSRKEAGQNNGAVWVLPPGTQTRALRFSHVAEGSDARFAGFLGAAFIAAERWSNLAPQAAVSVSTQSQKAKKLNNNAIDWGQGWENLEANRPAPADAAILSAEHAPWVALSWPVPVSIGGLNLLGPGFAAAEVQTFAGAADKHPRDAAESDWKPVAAYTGLRTGYPVQLWPNFLLFAQPVTTRGLRVRMIAPANEALFHPHEKGTTKDGKRAYLGEIMALQPLGNTPFQPVKFPEAEQPHPPIAVPFELAQPGFVTLVIENEAGQRVRNLVSETPFPAGKNIAWWDGADDLGRDLDAARHGLYKIPTRFVPPGNYRVRGLVRGEIEPRFEFPIYTAGNPAWETADKTGGWLTNHTPPMAALFLPGDRSPTKAPLIYLGSAVSEGGAGLAWVDQDGTKLGGRGWIGGNWTSAPYLARDAGAEADAEVFAYVGATASASDKDDTKGELRITGLRARDDKAVLKFPFSPAPRADGKKKAQDWQSHLGGIAANQGVVVASLRYLEKLLSVEARTGRVLAELPLESPRGLAFDGQGRLLVLSGARLLRYSANAAAPGQFAAPQTVIASGLEDPIGLTTDAAGQIFISDLGASQQVKIFSAAGKLVRAIGKPGASQAGPYDPLHLNHPAGLAIDANGRLWVTENDYLPKRVSVWNADGTLWKAFYGPAKYGGGGALDPRDKTRFYYADDDRGTIEFKLDWEKGTSLPVRILYRRGPDSLKLPDRTAAPESALDRDGRRYFSNSFNSNPVSGSTSYLFLERNGLLQPVAGAGYAGTWKLLQTEPFAARLPAGVNWKDKLASFFWSDRNDDGQVQPEEVEFFPGSFGGVTIMPDLSFCVARMEKQAMRFAPTGFTPGGVPLYDVHRGEVLVEGMKGPASSGGDQVLPGEGGWTVATLGIAPFSGYSLAGAYQGQGQWSYPSLWPGLHAGHEAPVPRERGQLIATTRLLGGFVTPKGSDAGQIWGVNGNMGSAYLFTADGLFVTTLFKDRRVGKPWVMPVAERNMNLAEVTLSEENFWPTLSQTSDGNIYLMNGGQASLVRIDGLETIRRLPARPLQVSLADLQKAQSFLETVEAQRQQEQGRGVLEIALRATAPSVDGKVDDWAGASWVEIDKSGSAATFNSDSRPYDVSAAVAIAGDRLYAAWRVNDDKLLQNSGEIANAPFKTGGALDLMLGVNPKADPKRTAPVAGDLRLLVTLVQGKPRALLYRPVVAGTKEPIPFSSPWRTITIDRVDDLSPQVQFAGAKGNYEISIPLSALALKPEPGQNLRGDIGILRGSAGQTTARVYWSNKATGITSDVPSEAALTPQLWGPVVMKPAP